MGDVLQLAEYRQRPPLPNYCLKCGEPGARGRCVRCIDALRRARPANRRCHACRRELPKRSAVALDLRTQRVYCTPCAPEAS